MEPADGEEATRAVQQEVEQLVVVRELSTI